MRQVFVIRDHYGPTCTRSAAIGWPEPYQEIVAQNAPGIAGGGILTSRHFSCILTFFILISHVLEITLQIQGILEKLYLLVGSNFCAEICLCCKAIF